MYYFYLDKTLLPVAPEKLTIKINNQNKTMNLISEGQVNIIKSAGLTDISFEALIPAVEYSFSKYKNGFIKPYEFIKAFEKLKSDKKPFQFIVTRTKPDGQILFDTNIKVTLESYSMIESSDDGFDVRVAINLKQFKDYGTKTVTVINDTAVITESVVVDKMPEEQQHKVIVGDSLMTIAKKYYGDGSQYPKIYNANQAVIDDGNKSSIYKYTLHAGQILTIPS